MSQIHFSANREETILFNKKSRLDISTLRKVCAVQAEECRTKSFPQSVLHSPRPYCTYLMQGDKGPFNFRTIPKTITLK